MAHVKLAQRRARQRAVRHAIDHAAAHAANALAAIAVEGHRVFVSRNQILVQNIEHLKERHVLADVRNFVSHHAALLTRATLPPDVQNDAHYL
jgi:hypothetical protein